MDDYIDIMEAKDLKYVPTISEYEVSRLMVASDPRVTMLNRLLPLLPSFPHISIMILLCESLGNTKRRKESLAWVGLKQVLCIL